MFRKAVLTGIPSGRDTFQELTVNLRFEETGKGRLGANIVVVRNGLVPLVRTTTIYQNPTQPFTSAHHALVQCIQVMFPETRIEFNNAMVEVYDKTYRKMKYHTDQALDLDPNSYIGVVSSYQNGPSDSRIRHLIVKDKKTGTETDVPMEHNSLILFSVASNRKHLHRIIYPFNKAYEKMPGDNRWLGITFRLSKMWIEFRDMVPFMIHSGNPLRMATEEERKAFYEHKSKENDTDDFKYPEIDYTISPSDLIKVQNYL